MNSKINAVALATCLALFFSSDVHAQRRGGGGAGGGRPGGGASSKGSPGGNPGGGAAGGRGGMNSGGFGRAGGGGSSGLRATGGSMNRQPGAQQSRTRPDFNQSIGQIRGGSAGINNANSAVARDGNPGLDRRNVTDGRNLNNIGGINNGPQAFTADWYANNPNAWRFTHPHADAYAVAATPNMMGWWGYPGGSNTVVVPGGAPVGTTATQPVEQETQNQQPAAENQGDWLPIGVFSLTPSGKSEVTRAVQLATSKSGEIKGNQVDLLSDTSTEVHGRYDAESKSLQWTVGKSNGVLFTALAESFNKPGQPIPVDAHYADGTTSDWVMTPIPNPEDDARPSPESR